MDIALKIQQLWKYLEVQDNEILIIRHYNQSDEKDECLIAEATQNGLVINKTESLSDLQLDKPFRIIQQRDSSGKFIIPSVTQMVNDKVSDY